MAADKIKRGKSEVLEFKGNELQEDTRKWLKTAFAFANGKDGSIVFKPCTAPSSFQLLYDLNDTKTPFATC